MKDKRAASIILFIFVLMTVLIVSGMVLYVSYTFSKSETLQKELFTQDLWMMANALIAVPGDAVVQYPHHASSFVFIFTSSEVVGFLKGEEKEELGKVRKYLSLPLGYSASGSVEGVAKICLEKRNQHLSIRPCEDQEVENG